IWNANACKGIAGKLKSRKVLDTGVNLCHQIQMPYLILSHGLGMAFNLTENGFCSDAQQLLHVLPNHSNYFVLVQVKHFWLQRSAHEGPQQGMVLWRASCEFNMAESARQYLALFDGRHDKTETIQWTRNVLAAIGQIYGDGRGVLNALQFFG